MLRPKPGTTLRARKASGQSVSLKSLAEHLGLSQAAVSLVINRSPGAKSIPHRTQELIRQAARELIETLPRVLAERMTLDEVERYRAAFRPFAEIDAVPMSPPY